MAQPKIKIVLLLVLIFLLGTATGALGYRLLEQRGFFSPRNRAVSRDRTGGVVDRFTRELGLTPEQGQQLSAILKDNEKKFAELRRSINPQAEAIRQEGRNQIRAILTEEQKPKFEEMLRKTDEERRKHEEASKTH
jgi:Spy/CpxP family protein refolding chaperone